MFATLTKEVRIQDVQSLWIDEELREEARNSRVFPVGSTVIVPIGWKECKQNNAPMEVQLANGELQARFALSYSTLLEVTDMEARAASDLAREAYAARLDWADYANGWDITEE